MALGYTFFPTVGEIIKSALEVLRVTDIENPAGPTTNQYARAVQALNYMLTAWQAHGMQLWCRKTTTFSLTQGTVSYSIGQGGYDINTQIPLKVYQAWRTDTSGSTPIDTPLSIISEKEYLLLTNKQQEGTPISIFYEPKHEHGVSGPGTFAYGLIYVYQPADLYNVTNCTIGICYQRPFVDFDATTDSLEFPQEWFDAVKYNLAVRLAHTYGTPQLEYDRIKRLADDLLNEALSFDTENTSLLLQPRYR